MLPPGGSVDSWYMMRAVRQPFPSCFRRSQKEAQKRRESSLGTVHSFGSNRKEKV